MEIQNFFLLLTGFVPAYLLAVPAFLLGNKKVEWKWIDYFLPPIALAFWLGTNWTVQALLESSKSLSNYLIEMILIVQLSVGVLVWLRLVPRFRRNSYAWVGAAIACVIILCVSLLTPPLAE